MFFRWQKKSWSKEHVVLQPLVHWGPAWICYLGLLSVSLRQKFQIGLSINFLLQNDFKHNKYNKEECHKPYILSFGINKYKTILLVPPVVIDWRLQHQSCGQLSSRWRHSWLASVFLFLLSSHMWWLKRTRRRRIREKNRERLTPSWGTTIKTPCQLAYLPKALLPNTITLGVKGGHNSIHSSYAVLFLNQDRLSFHSLFYFLFIFPEVF